MFRSIRARIMSWHLLVTALLITAFSLILFSTVADSLYRGVDMTLLSKAEAIISGLDLEAGQWNFPQGDNDFSAADLLIQLSDLGGNILARSANLGRKRLPLNATIRAQALKGGPAGSLATVSIGQGPPLRLLTVVDTGDGTSAGLLVQVGISLKRVESTLGGLRFWLLIIAPTLLLLSSLGSFFLADRLLRPLKTMAQTAESIGEHSLSERLPVANPEDEIGQLAGTFNRMFGRLQRAFEQQKRFVSDASHELRTPLTVLRGQLEVALRRRRSAQEYRQVLETSLGQAERLSRLVQELLLLARADSGKWQPDFQPVELAQLCTEIAGEIKTLAERRQIALEVACAKGPVVYGDPLLLRRMIANLLDNAIRYTQPGGQVRLSLELQGDLARLSVADTGLGIPTEELSHVFERFYRADQARSQQRAGGTGLGLAIVREIVRVHQGQIEVESTPGEGTIFTVRLPLYRTATRSH